MMTLDKETAIRKIAEMPIERVSKVLIFMAGMERKSSAVCQAVGAQHERKSDF